MENQDEDISFIKTKKTEPAEGGVNQVCFDTESDLDKDKQ